MGNVSYIKVIIPDGVEFIGNGVFYRCGSLTSVEIPGSVAWIDESAFYEGVASEIGASLARL